MPAGLTKRWAVCNHTCSKAMSQWRAPLVNTTKGTDLINSLRVQTLKIFRLKCFEQSMASTNVNALNPLYNYILCTQPKILQNEHIGHYPCRTQKQEGIMSAPRASDTSVFMIHSLLIKRTKKGKPDYHF